MILNNQILNYKLQKSPTMGRMLASTLQMDYDGLRASYNLTTYSEIRETAFYRREVNIVI